ncbi:MAG: M20/M25/M40 family metallo-hydrolase [Thaumarchaeota archaeon]|nr:M20/M25/M40 family metallo-hydrolase [Nitrososphaerota archaeon]
MTMDQAVREYIHDNQDRFLKDMARLVAQPSISAKNEGVEECALLAKKMIEEIGGTTKLLKLEGAPTLVFGEVPSSSKKTLLFYNHYDVQPVEPLELWKSPPFEPEVRDGRMYGRGVSDDKGQLVARLKLIEAYVKVHGEPPCNIKFCFEGEEEVGSGHLDQYVATYPDLFKSDAVIWEFGKIDEKGRPVIGLGVKGMIYLELVVRTLNQDAHSMYAAALPNPVWRLVRLLNLIKDEREAILIPGWYDKVLPLAEDELRVLEEEPSEAEHLLSTYGASGFAGDISLAEAKRSLASLPTANIAGIWAGYQGPGSKTVLPAEVHCKMDFRLVPDQDPVELLASFKKFLGDHGYADVQVIAGTMEPAARTSYKSRLARAASDAAEQVFKTKPVLEISSAGTGPLYIFARRYGADAIDIGFSPIDDGIHAPNENVRLDLLEKGMVWMGQTIENYIAMA